VNNPKIKAAAKPIKPGQVLLSKGQVLELLDDISYSCLFNWMRNGDFPLPIMLGPNNSRTSKMAWRADAVHAWIDSRPERKLRPISNPRRKPARAGR
jgi:predicted DNA-binding transcriptional regulator AlpA